MSKAQVLHSDMRAAPGASIPSATGPSAEGPESIRAARAKVSDELWRSYWRNPDDGARNDLVEAYQWLVHASVRRFAVRLPRSVDRGDLLTAGSVGLMGAISSFDPTRRVRFEVYADARIRGALLDELRKEDWLPRPWRQRLEKQKRVIGSLRADLGRDPNDGEVADALDLTLEVYEQTFGTGLPGAPNGSSGGPDSAAETAAALEIIPDTRLDSPGERLTREEMLRLVAQRLTQLEYQIVYLRYWEELPMREIGDLTNLSESRVSKIHARLLERLQDRFRSHFDLDQ